MTDVPGGPAPVDDSSAEAAAASAAALRRATRSTAPAKPSRSKTKDASYSDDRDPKPLGAAIDRLVRDQGWQDQSAVAILMSEWSQIVGHDIAEHVHPVSFDEGVLTVQAASTTWATQVRLLLPDVHRAVDARVGVGVVTKISILGPQAPSWVSGPRRVKGRGPRDTYG
jgi:predicted nucleic acid-binding Zn ribbon protein